MARAASSRLAHSESTHAATSRSCRSPFSTSTRNRRIQARTVSYWPALAKVTQDDPISSAAAACAPASIACEMASPTVP